MLRIQFQTFRKLIISNLLQADQKEGLQRSEQYKTASIKMKLNLITKSLCTVGIRVRDDKKAHLMNSITEKTCSACRYQVKDKNLKL